jgi:transposase
VETCCGAQHLGRFAAAQGFEVKLIPAQHVRPFVKSQKNDFNDATALAEIARMPNIRAVPLRSVEQIDVQAVHRARQRLLEGLYPLRTQVPCILEDAENGLSPRFRGLLAKLLVLWRQTEEAIEELTEQIACIARQSDTCRRLQTVPGVGPLVSTALVAAVGNASSFRGSRFLSAWVGLVPRPHTTGGKPRLLGITKRGDTHLRRLFVQGARALWVWKDQRDDPLHAWIRRLAGRMHPHVAICALANKLVRICWALLRHEDMVFQHAAAAA